jgi:hypothetical protein
MLTAKQVLSGDYDWFIYGQCMDLHCPPGVTAVERTDDRVCMYFTNGGITQYLHSTRLT